MRRGILGVAAAAALLWTGAAQAEVESAVRTADGDHYKFIDDLLNSEGTAPKGVRITVRPPPLRSLLIRPRTSFVPEMLKSVENM